VLCRVVLCCAVLFLDSNSALCGSAHIFSIALYVLITLRWILTGNGEEVARPMAPTCFRFKSHTAPTFGLHSVNFVARNTCRNYAVGCLYVGS
jgi:hypothetical protein